LKEKILQTVEYIRSQISTPEIGLILGTGLGSLGEKINNPVVLPYEDIPNFPQSTVKFHAGKLIYGELAGKKVLAMQGRFHYYEGYPMHTITLPIRVMQQLGVNDLIISNAAGGIRKHLVPGSLAVINDHINLMGNNPLIGVHDDFFGPRFPDMSEPYDKNLIKIAQETASELDIVLHDTIYSAISGPSFETSAEIKMLQVLGADTVGMSVVPEVIVANQVGINVLAITAVTDQSLPEKMEPISHEQVSRVANEITPKFEKLVMRILEKI